MLDQFQLFKDAHLHKNTIELYINIIDLSIHYQCQ